MCHICNPNPCNCQPSCNCSQSTQTPCVDGCLDFPKSKCVQSSTDIIIGSTIHPVGTNQNIINQSFASAINNGVTVTTSDFFVKASASDTQTNYLFSKLLGSNSINLTLINPGNNESIKIDSKISSQVNNALSLLPDGLFVSQNSSSNSAVFTTSTNSINITSAPVLGGFNVSANAKISALPGNQVTVQADGLFVAAASVANSLSFTNTAASQINNWNAVGANLVGSNVTLFGATTLSPDIDNLLVSSVNGLKVSAASVNQLSAVDTFSIDHTITAGVLSSNLRVDPASTVTVTTSAAGVKFDTPVVPASTITANDTNTIDHTITSGVLTSALKYDNSAPSTQGVLFGNTSNGLNARIVLDPNINNRLSLSNAGLFSSAIGSNITAQCELIGSFRQCILPTIATNTYVTTCTFNGIVYNNPGVIPVVTNAYSLALALNSIIGVTGSNTVFKSDGNIVYYTGSNTTPITFVLNGVAGTQSFTSAPANIYSSASEKCLNISTTYNSGTGVNDVVISPVVQPYSKFDVARNPLTNTPLNILSTNLTGTVWFRISNKSLILKGGVTLNTNLTAPGSGIPFIMGTISGSKYHYMSDTNVEYLNSLISGQDLKRELRKMPSGDIVEFLYSMDDKGDIEIRCFADPGVVIPNTTSFDLNIIV